MNVNDTDRILQVLAPHGWGATDDPAQASLILLNTCSVRDKAEQKMMSQLGRLAPLKEHNDEVVLGVAGCVAQQEGADLLKKVPYLDLVFGPDHIADLPALLERVKGSERRVAETSFLKRKDFRFVEADPPGEARVSEFVTIMKGCDKVCSFCIVPFTRGREVSKPDDMVVREVERLVAAGAREVTLLGQNVNSYGKDLNLEAADSGVALRARVPTFAQLLRRVDAVPGLERLRFTTSHPMDAIDDLIACFGELRTLCEYFHLPVQSGSDQVLEAMRRSYTRADYLDKIGKLRQRCPDIALSTDIIVGFPGETEAQFEDTLSLLAEVGYDNIYAFKYSERPGTRAEKLGDTVPAADKDRRLDAVLQLQRDVTRRKMLGYVGRTLEILVEGPSQRTSRGAGEVGGGGFQMMGRTRSNVIVNVPVPLGEFWSRRWVGRLAQVVIEDAKANSLFGRFA
ncbi:MAG: tRNA (N6-isopentenyl adenosine(37)-C2)-methylthiotransferase MiaB [Deltaproteobacteria bacterium]|nr:tRNA (N6-isopentenyl adenosine(37)-C2)-methylthiotransferase MiaB [Deltaproteobacteria bacterium]